MNMMKMNEIELKPCPFCGGQTMLMGNEIIINPLIDKNGAYIDADFDTTPSYVECQKRHASTNWFSEDDNNQENAIEAWNRRY